MQKMYFDIDAPWQLWEDFAKALKEIEFDGVLSLETDVSNCVKDESERESWEKELANRIQRIANGMK